MLWINGLDRHLRIYRYPDSLPTLSSTSAFLGSDLTRHLRVPNHCVFKLRFFESAPRFDDFYLAYAEIVASPDDFDTKTLDYGSIWNRRHVRPTFFLLPPPHS